MKISRLLAGIALVLLPSAGSAQVYRWEDPGGTMYFTNAADRVPESHRALTGPPPAEPAGTEEPAVAPAPAESPAGRALARIPFSPGAPIVVNATISDGSAPVTLILDTGADRTIIAPRALSGLGISTLNAARAVIKGVTGSEQAEVVEVSAVRVGDATVGPLRIVAHDADLKLAEGLLGRDFLDHFTVTIDAREQIVTLSPR